MECGRTRLREQLADPARTVSSPRCTRTGTEAKQTMRLSPSPKTLLTTLALAFPFLAMAAFLVPPIRQAMVGFVAPLLWARALAAEAVVSGADRVLPLKASERTHLRDVEARLRDAELELRTVKATQEENRELRALLDLPVSAGWQRVAAPVVVRDPVTWNRRFRIGKGSAHGVREGAIVLAGSDVVGRVAEVSRSTALVLTVADPACKLSVRLPQTGATGVLSGRLTQKWHGVPLCLINYLPRDKVYDSGEVVVTSGLGGPVPPGIRVGHVIPWDTGEPARIVKTAYVQVLMRPTARFDALRHVGVLCPVAPAGSQRIVTPNAHAPLR